MVKKHLFILLLVVPALLLAGVARAQDDEDADNEDAAAPEVDTQVPEQAEEYNSEKSEFATTKVIFTDHSSLKFPAGSFIPVLIGFQNTGEAAFHIKEIEGSFRHPLDYTYHIQNFSSYAPDVVVGPKQVVSFNYYIRPYLDFEPREIGLQINVHYESADGEYHDAAFNGTVSLVDSVEDFDGTNIVGYVIMLFIFAGLVHFFRPDTFTKASSEKVETGTVEDNEGGWDEAHQAVLSNTSTGKKDKEVKKTN